MTRAHLGSITRRAVLVLALLGLGDAGAATAVEPLVLVYDGSRLSVRESAPVAYSELSDMLAALGRDSHVGRYAIMVFRDSPREIVGYVLVVGREGTLSLGSQLQEWDPGDRRYRFRRGELYRSVQPLEGNSPWTWLVTIPVNRELHASLLIRASELRWPVRSVSISVTEQQTH